MESRSPEARIRKTYNDPTERVMQARLRLLAAMERKEETGLLFPLKKSASPTTAAFAFAAGFIAGFYPSIAKTIVQKAPSLLRCWLINRINH